MTEQIAPRELEQSDVSVRWTLVVGWGFGGLLVLLALFLWWKFGEKIEAWREDTATFSLERYPEPRLLANPAEPLLQVQSREAQELNLYAWRDPAHHVAQVPLARALKLIADQKLIRLNLKPLSGDGHVP
jgi:hypothetical protein